MNRTPASSLLLAVAALALASAACGGSSTSLAGSGGGTDASAGDSSSMTTPSDDAGGMGSDDGGEADAASPPLGDGSASQACSDWAAARCNRYDACSDGLYNEVHFGDEAACEAASVQTCMIGLAATGTADTTQTFEACAAAIPSESCSDFLGGNPVAACAAKAGSVAAGAACIGSSQCQSTYCAIPQYATCGVCAAVPVAGDKCAVDADCGARGSMTCNTAGVCVVLGAATASCGPAAPCDIGLDCVGVKKGQQGTCMTAVSTVGAACDPTRATAASCDPTLYLACDLATKTCVQDTVVTAGGTCGAVGGGDAKCSAGGACALAAVDAGSDDAGADAGAAATTGACVAAAATGSACDIAVGPGCLPPSKCVLAGGDAGTGGTCQVANPATCK